MRLAWQREKTRCVQAKQGMEVGERRVCRWTGVKSSGAEVECVDGIGNLWKVIWGQKLRGPVS